MPATVANNSLIVGIVLAVVTFRLFAQTTLNVAPIILGDLQTSESVSNVAVSITALFSVIDIRFAAAIALLFNVLMVVVAIIAITLNGAER
jgi:MFS transporter, DHA2 family, multidrug resistance protein